MSVHLQKYWYSIPFVRRLSLGGYFHVFLLLSFRAQNGDALLFSFFVVSVQPLRSQAGAGHFVLPSLVPFVDTRCISEFTHLHTAHDNCFRWLQSKYVFLTSQSFLPERPSTPTKARCLNQDWRHNERLRVLTLKTSSPFPRNTDYNTTGRFTF